MAVSTNAINRILVVEGGFVNNPSDTGGATKFGITKNVYEKFVGHKVSLDEIKNMPIGNAIRIYKESYWDKIRGDDIDSFATAYAIFDQAVNWGPKVAIMRAQKALDMVQTGTLSDTFIESLNMADEETFINDFLNLSSEAYKNLVQTKPSNAVFLSGWLKRVEKIKSFAFSKIQQAVSSVVVSAEENPITFATIALGVVGGIIFYYYKKNQGRLYAN